MAITPNGKADAVTQYKDSDFVFALPHESNITMSSFLDHLTNSPSVPGNIAYMQQQNDCLRQEFEELYEDILPGIQWADEAFGKGPEAVNLWIGTQDSVTSFHKDHYENLFAVLRGSKIFTLLPPNDVYRLSLQDFEVAQYCLECSEKDNTGINPLISKLHLQKQIPECNVKWCPIDPLNAQEGADKFPLFFDSDLPEPIEIEVQAGEILYLPSLWHHYVRQTNDPGDVCMGVNFWYDMVMGSNYANFCLAEKLSNCLI